MKNVPDFKTPKEQIEFLEAKKNFKSATFAYERARIVLASANLLVRELEAKPDHTKMMNDTTEMLEARQSQKTAAFASEHARIAKVSTMIHLKELEAPK